MMKTKMKSLAMTIGVACTTAFSQTTQFHTLTVYAENFENNSGQSIANLFVKGENLKQKPAHQMSSKLMDGKAVFQFDHVPYGEYAIILWHDQNSNADLDHSFGMPSEPMGYSNGWHFNLFSGMPTFEKLKFTFSQQTNTITIKLR